MRNVACLTAAALAFCLGCPAQAYKETTHEALSEQAAAKSFLSDPTFLSGLGLGPWAALDYVGDSGAPRTLQQIIGFGARFEDTPFLRSRNHFFDPQFQNFAGRGLNSGPFTGLPSPDWALEDRGEVSGGSGVGPQFYSYRHAQQQYLAMLTAQSPASQRTAASSMFQMLGMIIHHIQDMAQPQHTRNDTHLTSPASIYERYTADNVDGRIALGQFTNNDNAYPIPAFPTARQFWHSVSSQTDLVPRYVGAAEFTAQNYVSLGSIFSIGADGTIANNPEFRLPNGVSADGKPKRLVRTTESVRLANGVVKTDVMEYVVGSVYDGFLNQSSPDRLLASRSILTGPTGRGRPRALAVGPKVFDNHYDVLFPRAIAFSAGLINHFFRGRVNLRRNPSGTGWFIDNVGQQDMNGTFAIFYDDAADTRQSIVGASWRIAIPAGQGIPVSFTEPPSGTKRLVAVFAGQIGAEGEPEGPASGFFTTAGKVIPYSPPGTASCGVPIRSSGSSGTTDRTLTIGASSQSVTANFEAYSIPDKLELLANGVSLAGTGGLVSGRHSFTFTFDPKKLGTTQLLARVTGNSNQGTVWDLCVDCNNPAGATCQSAFAQRQVTFRMSYNSNAGWTCNAGNISVDGQSRGFMDNLSLLRTMVTVNPAGERHTLSAPNAGCICQNTIGGCSFDHNAQFFISYIDGAGQTQGIQVPLIQARQLQFDVK